MKNISPLAAVGDAQKKADTIKVRSGDTVRVTQKIQEGSKFRLQVFEGVVINHTKKNSHTARITVLKNSSGVLVEKSFLIHSPLVEKIEITKRAKVRRNYLSFLRERTGKSARLKAKDFNYKEVNAINQKPKTKSEDKETAKTETKPEK